IFLPHLFAIVTVKLVIVFEIRGRHMNLTAVKDGDEIMERYVEDTLAILLPLKDCYHTCCGGAPSHEKLSLVDVGTGVGLSGVVFVIACPGCICG
ncbi:hypothetical protein S83_051142, partial [Arachis hypogaea]